MKRLLKVTSFTALLTLLKMACGFIIAKVVAIYAGPTGLAMLGQLQSLISSLSGIVNAPVGAGVIRYTAEYNHKGLDACTPWWRASLQWSIALLVIIMPLGYFNAPMLSQWLFEQPDYAWLIVIISFVLPFSAIGTLVNSVINGQQQYRRFVVLGMISVLISSSIMVTLIIYQNIDGALLAASIQTGLIGIVMLISSLRQPWFKLRYWFGQTETKHKKAIGGYVLMAVTSALTVPVALMLVRNLLVEHVGWEQAGQWQAVWKISEVYLGVITMALGTYYLPKLSSLKGVDSIRQEINKTVKIILPIVFILAVAVYLLRDVAIYILFTDEFTGARDLFLIQLIGDVVKIASWMYAYPMLSRGATKWFVSTEIIFSILFVFFAWFFIPSYGAQGANIAYLVNYSIFFLFIYTNLKRFSR